MYKEIQPRNSVSEFGSLIILSKFTQVRFTKVYLSKFISAYEKVRINYVRTLLA